MWNGMVSASASTVVCAVKFVISFTRRQHQFDIAATPIDVDSNILSYFLAHLLSSSNFPQNVII